MHGTGEIMIISIDRDGTKSGFDLVLTRAVSSIVSAAVLASGLRRIELADVFD